MRRSTWIATGWIAVALAIVLAVVAVAQYAAPAMAAHEPDFTARDSVNQQVCIQWTHTADLQFYRNDNTRIDGDARERSITVTDASATGPSNQQFFTNADYGMNYNRWRDEQGNLNGNGGSKNSWGFITPWTSNCSETEEPPPTPTPDPTPTPTSTPAPDPESTYTVTHVQIDGARDSEQAVRDANKTASGTSSGHHEFTLTADATTAEILAAADALSTHSITLGSRYIDAGGEVHNFHSGKRTYWLITKSEVNVVEPDPDPDQKNVGVNTPTLTGPIADQELTKGVLYTSVVAFPVATGGTGPYTYTVANLPSGITLDTTTRKLTGTATAVQAQAQLTYTATDTSDSTTATLTFNLSVLIDYDTDDDGLIETANLAQLDAIRWDLDGNGAAASGSDTTNYAAAFPNALTGMGCNEDAANDSDKVCTGYELTADLDFDTDGDGTTDSGDAYWNSDAGWTPIDEFATTLEGNGHAISNLFINATSGDAGLFDTITAAGEVRNLGLIDVDVSSSSSVSNDRAGGLAGNLSGDVISVYVSGGTVARTVKGNAGGLIGNILAGGSVKTSWSSATVSAAAANTSAGGLTAGLGVSGQAASIADSYATGAVTHTGTGGRAGGLVGVFWAGTLDDSYATGAVSGATSGGLVGFVSAGTTVTTSYYDTTTTGQTGDPGKTTSELQTPTSAEGIYADWSADKWDFREAHKYPLLKADFDGDGTATWQEFGNQNPVLVDYDADNDGLIEVNSLARLNAIRWDLNGDGAPSSGNYAIYATAFPTAAGRMGCPSTGCIGYELTANLDFDSDGDGDVDANDHSGAYWNAGKGWTYIGAADDSFTAEFEGNGKTIANLFIQRSGVDAGPERNGGLFGVIGASGKIRNLGLTGASVTSGGNVGVIAGSNAGSIVASYADGDVGANGATGVDDVGGGLVGKNTGSITGSYSRAKVFATNISGGLVGQLEGSITDSYAALGVSTFSGKAGGLVGSILTDASITDSYSVAPVTKSTGTAGGLVAAKAGTPTVTASYWDTGLSGQSASPGGGVGKTTSELQSPTSNTGIYSAWETTRWDFVDANHFPFLKADWDATSGATRQEFGEQDPSPAFAADASIADISIVKDAAYTSTDALPLASGGNGTRTYSMTGLPAGLSLNSERKITGTPTEYHFYNQLTTYIATDTDDDTAELTFKLGVGPKATTLTATAGDVHVTLTWTAISDVSRWRYSQDNGTTYEDVPDSSGLTVSHRVTGLTNSTAYTFRVYAVVDTADGDDYINGLSSNSVAATPLSTLEKVPYLGTVADQTYVQGTAVDFTLPAATGGDGHPSYVYTLLPAVPGLTFTASTRKLTGTPSAPRAKISYDYKATESSDPDGTVESDRRTFTIGVQPKKPANFTATGGDTEVTLGWTAITGVTSWEVKQDSGSWTAIASSGAATNSHIVTGLTNGTEYSFKVRALVGDSGATPSTQVIGMESGAESVTPAPDLVPALTDIADQLFTQGKAVDLALPLATGGDGHPSYVYTLTPAAPDGLTFDAVTRKLTGTPTTAQAETTYTYTATESADPDGMTESGSTTFTISVRPHAPELPSGSSGEDGKVTLSWTAIAGVSGWEYSQHGGGWTVISGSSATTNGHTVTGLDNWTHYTFEVRAFVGAVGNRLHGAGSDPFDATPYVPPIFAYTINDDDHNYTQGTEAHTLFPRSKSRRPSSLIPGGTFVYPHYYMSPGSPNGLLFDRTPPIAGWHGTPDTPQAKTTYTYTIREENGGRASLTFTASVKPRKPALTAARTLPTRGGTLSWDPIPGVSGWEYSQDDGATWTAISGSSDTTTSLDVTDLLGAGVAYAGQTFTFKVRAFVGTGDAKVTGVESEAKIVFPGGRPVFEGTMANQEYTQGVEVEEVIFPRATFPDGSYVRLDVGLSPALPSGLTADLTPPILGWSGTPDTPMATTTYVLRARDKKPGSPTAEVRFTVSVKPKKPADFSAAAGAATGQVALNWTAIDGVSGWEYYLISGWQAISGSTDSTTSHTVTGLNSTKTYTFKVRAFVGTGGERVDGVESDSKSTSPKS